MFILIFILLLVLLILVHEFGHFIVAKAFGIRVDEFGIFFPPRLWARKVGETEYSINWLPFGGFVKIFGENYDEGKNDPRSFVNKSRWKQAGVIVAGVAGNLLLAWAVLTIGYMAGLPTAADHQGFGSVHNAAPTVIALLPDSPAEKSGLMAGDVVEKVQTAHEVFDVSTLGTPPPGASEAQAVTNFMITRADESMVLTILRDNKEMTFLAKAQEGVVPGRKALGIELDDVGVLQLPPHLAVLQGAILGWDITSSTAQGLAGFFRQLVTGTANFAQVAGPIGITVFGAAAIKQGFAAAVVLVALISINLALINLIPIPGLDGGRLLVIIVEGIRGRPVSPDLINKLTLAGLALLVLLMFIVSYHDIVRLIG